MISGVYQPACPGENPRTKKADEGRRHISGKAARAAADDGAAADSEQAGQREKDPIATAARATPAAQDWSGSCRLSARR
jgi:hypothetical protein